MWSYLTPFQVCYEQAKTYKLPEAVYKVPQDTLDAMHQEVEEYYGVGQSQFMIPSGAWVVDQDGLISLMVID
jgi:hypothetical protein